MSLQNQLNSIFVHKEWNSQEILSKVFNLNNLNENNFNKIRPFKRIKIPDPSNQTQCNFTRTKFGIVSFKHRLETVEQKQSLLKGDKLNCSHQTVYQNFMIRKSSVPFSSMVYSTYLTPVWGEKGLMKSISKINGIKDISEYDKRSVFIVPKIINALGCNYIEKAKGEVQPLKLILNKEDKEAYKIAFLCAGPKMPEVKPEPELEPEPEPTPQPKEKVPRHHMNVGAASNFLFSQSDVSDVEVEIVSAYGIYADYNFKWKEKKHINFYTQIEYYTEVKNRELITNFLAHKLLNYEYYFKPTWGVTMGLAEHWYFDNIEVDDFEFVSSIVPYSGLTYHNTFFEKYTLDSELGILPPLDILNREKFKGGVFLNNNIDFKVYDFGISLGLNFNYAKFKRYLSQNITFKGGMYFDF